MSMHLLNNEGGCHYFVAGKTYSNNTKNEN